MPAFLDGLFFSEILADNPGSGTNTDGDNSANKSDEFIEIQNASGETIDLSNYQIWSQTNGLLYDFATAPGTPTVADGGTATVVGEYTGTPPPGFYDSGDANGQNFIPDGETSGMNNRADIIYLLNTDTGEYIYLSYGTDPLTVSPPFPTAGTTLVGGEVSTSGAPNGTSVLRDAEGNLVEGPPTPGVSGPVCFAFGTRILTPSGERMVETLRPGDLVTTLDAGPQPICWIGQTSLNWPGDAEKHKPIEIKANALGRDAPRRTLLVSPQHKVLLDEKGDGKGGCLAPAKALIDLPGVRRMDGKRTVTYVHLMLARHQIVLAEGLPTESFYPGPTALGMMNTVHRQQIKQLFPALRQDPRQGYGPTARPCLTYRQARAHVAGSNADLTMACA